MNEADRLLGRMADTNPITCNVSDGLADYCLFCNADSQSTHPAPTDDDRYPDTIYWAVHRVDCAWVAAMRYLSRDLGHHKVQAIPVETDGTHDHPA